MGEELEAGGRVTLMIRMALIVVLIFYLLGLYGCASLAMGLPIGV